MKLLLLCFLQLLNPGDTLVLIFRPPQLRLRIGSAQLLLNFTLGFGFFIQLFSEKVQVVLHVSVFAQKGGPKERT